MKKKDIRTRSSTRPIIYDLTTRQCIWAKAGVVGPMLCVNAFDCMTCPVDSKIQKDIARGKLIDDRALVGRGVMEIYRHQPARERKCRHMLTGLVSVKYCSNDYDCATCPYDQLLEEENLSRPAGLVSETYVSGFALARNYYYHRGHSWARVEYGGRVRVGLDDFSLRLVGRLDEFKLPKLGSVIRQGEPGLGLRRGDLEAEALSPVEGVVVALNPKVAAKARQANQDPYGQGWLMVIEPQKLKTNLKNLLFEDESQAWLEEEAARLSRLISGETDYQLAATGGRAMEDIYSQVPEIGWEKLINEFLLT